MFFTKLIHIGRHRSINILDKLLFLILYSVIFPHTLTVDL